VADLLAAARIHVGSAPGLQVLGLHVPWPPALVLWLLIAADVVATLLVWRRPRHWPWLIPCLAATLYLTVAALLTIGLLFLILFVAQAGLLIEALRRRAPG